MTFLGYSDALAALFFAIVVLSVVTLLLPISLLLSMAFIEEEVHEELDE